MACIFFYAVNSIGGQRGGIIDHIMEYLKPISVPSVQSVISTDPKEAVMILADTHDGVVGKALLDSKDPDRQLSGSDSDRLNKKREKTKQQRN
jgi:hypothetical protein